MKTLVRALLAIALLLPMLRQMPARAEDRVNWWYGQNPPSPWMNTASRDRRLGSGQWMLDSLGRTANGWYSNLSISPSGTLSVAVGPGSPNTLGAVYQTLPDDTATFGGGAYGAGTALPVDATQILAQGLTNTNLPAIPVGPGTSAGQAVDDLIECQVQTVDKTPQSVNFVSSSGAVTPGTANRDRSDIIVCQNKASASATTPVLPVVDTGWVGIGYVAVPYNTTTITPAMIFPITGSLFYGFTRASSPGAVAIDTSANAQVKTGSLGLGAAGGYNANGLQIGSGYAPGAYAGLVSSSSLSAGGVTGDYLGVYENGGLNALGLALNHSGDLGVAGVIKASGGATFPGLTAGNCVQVGSGGALQTASGPCGLGSGTITAVNPGTGIALTGPASAPTVGLAHSDYIDQSATPQTKLGSLSLSNGLTISSGGLSMGASNQGAFFGYSVNTQGNYYAGPGASSCLWPNQSTAVGLCVNPAGDGTVTHNFSAPGTLTTGGIVSAGNIYANNGAFAAPGGSVLQLCPNNTCGGTYVDTSQNLHANIVAATQFTGSGAGLGLHTIPNTSLVTTPVTSLLSGTGISVTGSPGTPTVSNIGVTSLLSGTGISVTGSPGTPTVSNIGVTDITGIAGGNIVTAGNTGAVTISSNLLYDSNNGVFRPTGIICSGSTITNGSSQATVACGNHIFGATGTLFDAGFGNFYWLRVQNISNGSVTFGIGNQNGVGVGAGAGFYYTISSYY